MSDHQSDQMVISLTELNEIISEKLNFRFCQFYRTVTTHELLNSFESKVSIIRQF